MHWLSLFLTKIVSEGSPTSFNFSRVLSQKTMLTILINTMFPSYRIDIVPFQFLYRVSLLFPLEQIVFGMTFIKDRGWNAPIVKVIRGVWDSY